MKERKQGKTSNAINVRQGECQGKRGLKQEARKKQETKNMHQN